MERGKERRIRAVVFDLDHTLYDRYRTLEAITPRIAERFRPWLRPGTEAGRLAAVMIAADRGFVQLGWEVMYREICRQGIFLEPPALELFEGYVLGLLGEVAVAFPFVKPTLARLRQQGYLLGLITNGESSLQRKKLRLLELEDSFDRILISGDWGLSKPDVRVFAMMAEWLGVEPREMVYAGDHPLNDVDASRRAGCTPVWIRTQGTWCFPQTERAGYEADTVAEVPDIINKIEE